MQVIPIILTPQPVPNNAVATNLSQLVALVSQYTSAQIASNVSFFLNVTADPVTDYGVIIYNSVQNVFKAWNTGTGNYQPIGFLMAAVAPATNQGVVYNTTSNLFMVWNVSTLTYQPLSLIATSNTVPATQTLGAIFFNTTNQCLMWWNAGASPAAYQSIGIYYTATDPVTNVGQIFNTTSNVLKVWNPAIGAGQYSTVVPPQLQLGDEKTTYVAGDELTQGWAIENGRTIATLPGFTATQIANATTLFGTTLPTRAGSGAVANLYKVFIGFAN